MARKINAAARDAEKKYQQAAATIKDKTPTTDEAVEKLKQICYSYVAWVPGGRQYVDKAFDDLASLRATHGEEVDDIVSETYRDFQDIVRSGLSLEAASKAYDALANLGKKLASLSGSTAEEILARHPQLKERIGGPIEQLKEMGAHYGPEARKLADDTWKQISDIMASGFSAESVDKVRRLVEERTQQLRRIGDDLWEKGLEQAKPYLDKNPRIRDLVIDNRDALKQGNVTALFRQVKSLGESGDTGKLEDYVRQAVDKARSAGNRSSSAVASAAGGSSGFAALGQFLGTPSGDVGRKLQQNVELLKAVMEKHSAEGKELLEETKDDLCKVLAEKAEKAQKIVDNAQQGQ
ncbi:hypothetical protein VTK56DRAFT_8945 [Thermocarpiscus australiensis]